MRIRTNILDGIWEGIKRLEMKGVEKENICILMSPTVHQILLYQSWENGTLLQTTDGVIGKLWGIPISDTFPYNDKILIFDKKNAHLNPDLNFELNLDQEGEQRVKYDILGGN